MQKLNGDTSPEAPRMVGVEIQMACRHPQGKHLRGIFPKLGVVLFNASNGLRVPALLCVEYTASHAVCARYAVRAE